MSILKNDPTASSAPSIDVPGDGFHYARRGSIANEEGAAGEIEGYDAERMRARTLLTVEEEKKLLRRIDLRLMTLCSVMFLLKNIDADNVSNARIMNRGTPSNIMTQLEMSSNEYNLVTTIYYIPYILAEAPSNLVIKRLLPSRWQSRIMVTWGIALACHAAVKNKEGLYARPFTWPIADESCRCAIGTVRTKCRYDCCTFVSAISHMLTVGDILGNLSGVISGVLAFAFSHLDGAHGLSGWQWLFVVEAIITIAFGIALYWILPDFPPQAKWLSEKEKAFIQARLPGNAPQASEANFSWREILDALKDVRLWLFTLIWALMTIGTSGVRFYQPTVIADLGYTDIASAQLLNLPISILSIVVIGITGAFADNGRLPRPLYPLTFLGIILISYGVLYAYPSTGGVFAATIIGNSVTSAWYPMMWPWRAQSCSKATGSAFSIGFVNSYGQIGGAIGPHLFQSRYAPHYGVSFGIAMGFVSACILTTSFTWYLTRGTEGDTRRLKVARVRAQKRGETILDDVVDNDLKRLRAGKESEVRV
ncbi:putative pantothenate transporter [Paraphoma chrysanthemicola]|uniref:Pantothenate transporter n=1 Tax=Paraphoma chrysanthemicola TaxID=798071 RepID=A0A8K0RB50_9PLEO|nr:putative pantothenate transporter [Paraphoma chrysanthemicola]